MKYLMSDFNGKVYTISDGVVTELPELSRSDLYRSDLFKVYGFDNIPTSQQITSLTRPVIFRFSEKEEAEMRAVINAIPRVQYIRAFADLNNPSIKGISGMTAVYSGNVKVSYSYDNVNYTAQESMDSFLNKNVEEIYGGLQQNKKIYFRFVLMDENASFTNFVMTYRND